jgi:hypothetical protein
LADSHLVNILDSLQESGLVSHKPVYVGGGKIYYLNEKKILIQQDHQAAAPYIWPLAHDVRPALQSLGVRGCSDCHSTDSNFYFGNVTIQTPLELRRVKKQSMTNFLDQSPIAAWVFSFSFLFRPGLKYLIIFSSLITMAVLVLYGFRGLAKMISFFSTENN